MRSTGNWEKLAARSSQRAGKPVAAGADAWGLGPALKLRRFHGVEVAPLLVGQGIVEFVQRTAHDLHCLYHGNEPLLDSIEPPERRERNLAWT